MKRLVLSVVMAAAVSSFTAQAEAKNVNSYTYREFSYPSSPTRNVTSTYVWDLNNKGEMLGGYYYDGQGFWGINDYIYDGNAAFKTLDLSIGSGYTSNMSGNDSFVGISAFNDNNDLVGHFNRSNGSESYGFLYADGAFTKLAVPGGQFTGVKSLNNSGQVIGNYYSGSDIKGYIYDSNTGEYSTLQYPGADRTYPSGINDKGQIVGIYRIPPYGEFTGFIYDNGTFTSLFGEGVNSIVFPNDINNLEQITGFYSDIFSDSYSFLYENGRYTPLDLPKDTEAKAINDLGNIAGFRMTSGENGITGVAFMLERSNHAVPESATIVLLGLSIAGVGAAARVKRFRIC